MCSTQMALTCAVIQEVHEYAKPYVSYAMKCTYWPWLSDGVV